MTTNHELGNGQENGNGRVVLPCGLRVHADQRVSAAASGAERVEECHTHKSQHRAAKHLARRAPSAIGEVASNQCVVDRLNVGRSDNLSW